VNKHREQWWRRKGQKVQIGENDCNKMLELVEEEEIEANLTKKFELVGGIWNAETVECQKNN
jgi:hypothetical protein